MTERHDEEGRQKEKPGTGVPARGEVDTGANEPLGRSGVHHWKSSRISDPDLGSRSSVFFAAVEMTRMPMLLTDPRQDDNPIVFCNNAFLDLTGYEESEIIGRNCRFLQGPLTDQETVSALRDAVAVQRSIAVEILNYRRDGSPFWNAVFIGPVYDDDGELLYFFASQLDVSRRRSTEQAFAQAQKMEAIGQLTAGLAHDFNNLLQVVNGNLELLGGRVEEPRALRYIDSARTAAERGAKLTRQLLAFARKTRLETRPVDLSSLVAEFAEVLESSLGGSVELHLSLRRGLRPALCDRSQLEMALLNVVINARDAMPRGGLVTVTTAPVRVDGGANDLPEGDYIALEVRDEGTGMPPEVAARATEPFFTTKGVGKGTGLGLAMASGFAQQSRGRLEIETKPGEGTLVRMLFPVVPANAGYPSEPSEKARVPHPGDEDEASVRAPRVTVPESEPARGTDAGTAPARRDARAEPPRPRPPGRAHILLVEDSPGVRMLATEVLETEGYRVTVAENGDDGLRAFQELRARGERIDLLFTDLVMPGGLDGVALAERVAAQAPDLPVLMTTGYSEELVAQGPRRPAADVIGKPYRRAELLDRVAEAIAHKAGAGSRREASDHGVAEA